MYSVEAYFPLFAFKGEMDCKLLIALLQQFSRINNRVVEPAPDQLVQYKALVQSKAQELHGVSCDWRQQTIEEYEKAGDLTQLHFISAVHSLYYVDDADSSLMHLYSRLEPGGIMLVIIISGINFRLVWHAVTVSQENSNLNVDSSFVDSRRKQHRKNPDSTCRYLFSNRVDNTPGVQ